VAFLIEYPIISALLALGTLAAGFGAVLGFAAVKYKVEGDPIVDQIDEILPQTQCMVKNQKCVKSLLFVKTNA